MNLDIKKLSFGLVWMFLILFLASGLQSCKGDKKEEVTETVKDIDDFLDETSDDISDLTNPAGDDDEFEEEELSYEDLDESSEEDITDLTAPIEEEELEESYTPPPSRTRTNSTGSFLLVAGNYSIHSNAENMESKLRRMGYNNSEIVNFDNSSFSTVLAGRYEDYEAAVRASNELKSRGIDCYVHTKKY